jgi:Ni/Fe-hydrogenase subunit HybB-like protein
MDETYLREHDGVTLGFGKGAAVVLAGYFLIKIVGLTIDNSWHYLWTGYGAWFLVELLGFVALPCFIFGLGVREKSLKLIRVAAVLTVLGIVLNRFNVTLVAFNWQLPAAERYFPSWMEIAISLYIVALGLTIFTYISKNMPIFSEHPKFKEHEPSDLHEHKLKHHPQSFGH